MFEGRYEEKKKYYDKKNGIYALKKEVAISSNAPYFALFIGKGVPGATHDFTIYQTNVSTYSKYLKIAEIDTFNNPEVKNQNYWSLLADKGYIGKVNNQEYKKITPLKSNQIGYNEAQNKRISRWPIFGNNFYYIRARVYVECFFGRLTQKFKITTDYRFDHILFDTDIDNCILLVNEDIEIDPLLLQNEEVFYQKYLSNLKKKKEEVKKKREDAYEKTKSREQEIHSQYENLNKEFEDN